MRVNITERNNRHALMQGEYSKHIAESNGGLIAEHHLKVDRSDISDVLFANLAYRQYQSLSVEGDDYKDFYYTGKDDEGYLFSTRS